MSMSSLGSSSMGDSSNDEELSELRDWAATDFWLGKKYFEFTLLRVIVKDHSVCDPKTLESLLFEREHHYPFDQNVKYLQDQLRRELWRDTCTEYDDLMVTIGRIQRLGTAEDKTRLKKSLNRFGGDPASDVQRDRETSPPTPSPPMPSSPTHAFTQQPNGARRRSPDMTTSGPPTDATASPLHISTLQEYGNAIGEVPNYTRETHDGPPPQTDVTVTFLGRTLSSRARTARKAKQQVAKAACAELGLHVAPQ